MADLRKQKDLAAKALEKRNFAKAAELYMEIAQHEGEPDWRQRAGEAFRKAGRNAEAVEQLAMAVDGYARNGFLLKAIAVCKVVLQIDPKHTLTQVELAKLYALRERRSTSGHIELPPKIMPTRGPDAAQVAVDATTVPIDAVALRTVLPAHKSGTFQVMGNDVGAGLIPDAAVYEISLDDVDEITDDDVELDLQVDVRAPPVSRAAPLPAADSELDFGGLFADASTSPLPKPPAPSAAPRAPAPQPKAPELDFSALLDDETPAPQPLPTPGVARPLPQIPLFSSLPAEELQRLIEGVEVHDYEPGQHLMRQGEHGDSLFVVVSGRIRVYLDGELPQDLAILTDGAFVGELALLTDSPRSASVVTEEPTQVLEISRELVARVIAESPEVLRILLRFFRDRMVDRFLRTSSLFSRFSTRDARALVDRFRFLEVDPGTRLIREGERPPGLFLLLCGEVDVKTRAGAQVRLRPGDFFGEMSLLRPGPALASVDSVVKCWILSLPREDFQQIMVSYPQLIEYVAELAEERRQSKGAPDLV